MSKVYKGSGLSFSSDGVADKVHQQNADGTWSEAIPYPFFLAWRKQCMCGMKFWKMSSYQAHARELHTNGKRYNRTPKGLTEVEQPTPQNKSIETN